MDYKHFKASALNSIREYFGEGVQVSLNSIVKNNNIQLDGLMIEDGSVNITPTIYLNYYYEDYLAGRPLSLVLDDIISSYRNNLPEESIDLSFFTDYQKVKYHIIYKLINYTQNTELLQDLPHFRFLDLAVVFCCFLPDISSRNATILIHNHHLDFWDITADTLYELAVKNTPILLPYDLKSMEDVFKSVCPDNFDPNLLLDLPQIDDTSENMTENADIPMLYVLSNTEKYYGASAILYPEVLSFFADLRESDLYILPSSIHEVLLLPKDSRTHAEDLNCIIQEVNASQVLKEEVLSDHFYYFDRSLGIITQ